MEYSVVYEVTQESPDIWWHSILFVLIGLGVSLFNIKFNKSQSTKKKYTIVFGFVFAGFGLLFSLLVIPGQISQYYERNELYESGNFKTVEGTIENFDPMPHSGHAMESFTVGGQYFRYSDFVVHHGFNNTASHGGPITNNGQKVRLGYITSGDDNIILKIEIAN